MGGDALSTHLWVVSGEIARTRAVSLQTVAMTPGFHAEEPPGKSRATVGTRFFCLEVVMEIRTS